MKRSGLADTAMLLPDLGSLSERLERSGLRLRGGFNFESDEPAPATQTGRTAKSVVLIGNAGGEFWPHFQRWRRNQPTELTNPLDTWSRTVIEEAAAGQNANFVSPSDRPFMPFQQWAMRAEGLKPSPLGILMHPEWGLWHAYRGALLFDQPLGLTGPDEIPHLCETCIEKPCLRACPVEAYSAAAFEYQRCLGHVRGSSGGSCRSRGCLDRNACPYGTEYRYPADMQAFIMRAYAGLDR